MKYSDVEKRLTVRIDYIVESLELLNSYLKDVTMEQFKSNKILIDAVAKRMENIGEHANKIYDKPITHVAVQIYPHIEWQALAELRHLMVHEYEDVTSTEIYHSYEREFKPLLQEFIQIKDDIKSGVFNVKYQDIKTT